MSEGDALPKRVASAYLMTTLRRMGLHCINVHHISDQRVALVRNIQSGEEVFLMVPPDLMVVRIVPETLITG
jgi:hypothetical protein